MSESLSHAVQPKRYVTLKAAAEMIPMPSDAALGVWLHRYGAEHGIERRYRKCHWWEERVLTTEEVAKIQSIVVYGYEDSRQAKKAQTCLERGVRFGPAPGFRRPSRVPRTGVIGTIMRKALA